MKNQQHTGHGYHGNISHQGAQIVKAPFSTGGKAKGGETVRGGDLRVDRGGKSGK